MENFYLMLLAVERQWTVSTAVVFTDGEKEMY